MNPQAATPYYDLPDAGQAPLWRRGFFFAAIAGAHVAALALAFSLVTRPEVQQSLQALTVRVLEPSPPPPPKIEPAKPLPPAPVAPRKTVAAPPPPVLAAAPAANAAPSFAVAPQPEPRPIEAPPAPPAPLPVVAARFDADYLQNPRPAYPALSRRYGEEGKVVLRVRVSPQGAPLAIEIKQSSGYPRLDEAARAAVEKWRFVPARQGSEAVESWVQVPLVFKLES